MSYILDALKRAEAQRERGAVPGIHAQPGTGLPTSATPAPNARRVWWSLAGIALVGLAVLAWLLSSREARREAVRNVTATATAPAPAAQAVPAAPVVVAVTPSPQYVPAAPPSARAAPAASPAATAPAATAPTTVPTPAGSAPRVAARTASAALPTTSSSNTTTTTTTTPAAAPAPRTAQATTAPAPAPAATETRVYAREELPADIRAQLPAVTVNGSTYSANPAHRMLIANGQVFHENEKISAELTVEQIGPRGAVLGFRGYRYMLPF